MYLKFEKRLKAYMLFMAFIFSGCDYTEKQNLVEFPALPIIQRAISSLVPTTNGKINQAEISTICAEALKNLNNNSDIKNSKTHSIESNVLLSIGERGGADPKTNMVAGCASYIANTVMIIPNVDELRTDKNEKSVDIDSIKLGQILERRLATAKANSDIFALIAINLNDTKGKTLAEYDAQVKKIFIKLAPEYLRRIDVLAKSELGQFYTVTELTDKKMNFYSSSGYAYKLDHEGLRLTFNEIPWLGMGAIIGREYKLKVSYLYPSFKI